MLSGGVVSERSIVPDLGSGAPGHSGAASSNLANSAIAPTILLSDRGSTSTVKVWQVRQKLDFCLGEEQ